MTSTGDVTDEKTSEKLAAFVEAFNACTDATERVELSREINRLRRIIRQGGGE